MGLLDNEQRIYQNLLDFGQGDPNFRYSNILPIRYPVNAPKPQSFAEFRQNAELATPNFLRALPAQLFKSFTLPAQAVRGKMVTPQEATDFALTYGGTALTGASLGGVPKGAIGMFVGKKAEQSDPEMYKKAIEMEKGRLGRNRQFSDGEILEQTGFFRGVDGKWRREIPDDKAKLKPNAFEDARVQVELPNNKTYLSTTLDEYLDHEELFKNYPELKNIRIGELDKEDMRVGSSGYFLKDADGRQFINIRKDLSPTEKRSVILHEIQHAIQDTENFAKGGNTQSYEFYPKADVKARVQKLEGINKEILDAKKDGTGFEPYIGLSNFRQGKFANPKLTEALQTRDELSYLYDLDYLNSLKNINRPRDAFNSLEYYRYSNEISRKIGSPPKSGSQLEYARKVGDFLAKKQKEKMKAKSTADFQNVANDPTGQKFRYSNYETFYKDKTPQQIKNRIRTLEQKQGRLPNTREIENLQKRIGLGREADYGVYDNTMMNYDKPYEGYKRLAGEAEARLTEKRMDLDNQQRLNRENRMVSYGLRDDIFDVNPNQQLLVFPRGYND